MTSDPDRRAVPARASEAATGWFEFITPVKSLTQIAYVRESGEVYLPEGGDPDDFVLAASYGQVYRLVREADGDTVTVLAGLVAEMREIASSCYVESHRAAYYKHSVALVEAAQARLREGREQ